MKDRYGLPIRKSTRVRLLRVPMRAKRGWWGKQKPERVEWTVCHEGIAPGTVVLEYLWTKVEMSCDEIVAVDPLVTEHVRGYYVSVSKSHCHGVEGYRLLVGGGMDADVASPDVLRAVAAKLLVIAERWDEAKQRADGDVVLNILGGAA